VTDDYIDVPLTDDERMFLQSGLIEWGGPARCTDTLASAMGFASVSALHQEGRLLKERLGRREPLSRRDWTRVLVATEIVFASDVFGSGVEWATTTGIPDEDSVRLLRSIQRKIPTGGPGSITRRI
jgi:hypothetical protein